MSKHTPGPWTVDKGATTPKHGYVGIVDSDGSHVADIFPFGTRHSKTIDECLATADLIAAAPDMYETLKHIWDNQLTVTDPEMLASALAKAEGRS